MHKDYVRGYKLFKQYLEFKSFWTVLWVTRDNSPPNKKSLNTLRVLSRSL